MNEDHIDSLVLHVAEWIDGHRDLFDKFDMNNDALYVSLSEIIHADLEKFITTERNYN